MCTVNKTQEEFKVLEFNEYLFNRVCRIIQKRGFTGDMWYNEFWCEL